MKLKYGPYSPSRLMTATCGYAFFRQYVDPNRKPKQLESLPQARGGAVHEVLEKITRTLCGNPNKTFSNTEVCAWVDESIRNHPAAYPETSEIIDMAKLYIRTPPSILTTDAGIELRLAVKHNGSAFEECDYEDPEAYGRGRADIMLITDDTTGAIVYDHKTQPNIESADTFQMGFYSWVISKIYPFLSEIKTVLHFARYGSYSQPHLWTKDDLERVEDEIMTRISIVENTTSWTATPNHHCQYCPFMLECPALAEFVTRHEDGKVTISNNNLAILGDVSRAVKLAGLANILDELRKAVLETLKEHVKQFGPVAIPGVIYSYKASEPTVDWDKVNKSLREATYAVFKKHEVDPKTFMSFNQTASKSIWMTENEALVRELSDLFPRKVSTTFGGHKS